MRRDSGRPLLVALTTMVAGLIGLSANLLSSTENENVVTYISLGLALTATAIILSLSVRITLGERESADKTAEALEAAEKQADAARRFAQRAGLDGDQIYDEVLNSAQLPPEAKFIYLWSILEQEMRALVQDTSGESFAGRPLGLLIKQFTRALGLTEMDSVKLRDLLQTRNSIVHRMTRELDSSAIAQQLSDIQRYIELARRD